MEIAYTAVNVYSISAVNVLDAKSTFPAMMATN